MHLLRRPDAIAEMRLLHGSSLLAAAPAPLLSCSCCLAAFWLARLAFAAGNRKPPSSVGQDVLHFIYFSTAMNQFVAPGLSPPYSQPKAQQRLLRHYQSLALWLHRHQPRQRILCLASGLVCLAAFAWLLLLLQPCQRKRGGHLGAGPLPWPLRTQSSNEGPSRGLCRSSSPLAWPLRAALASLLCCACVWLTCRRLPESQTMLAWVDRDLELYMALSPLAVSLLLCVRARVSGWRCPLLLALCWCGMAAIRWPPQSVG